MANLDSVIDALVSRLKSGMTGTAFASRTFAYSPDSVPTPFAVVLPDADFITFDDTMSDSDEIRLVVKIVIGLEFTRTAFKELLGYLDRSGSGSFRAAIYGDRTLGSTVSDLQITGVRSFGDIEWAGVIHLGAEMTVTVWT